MNANTEASLMGPVLARSMNGCSLDELRALLPMVSEDTFAAVFETLSTFPWFSTLTCSPQVVQSEVIRPAQLAHPDPYLFTLTIWPLSDGLRLVFAQGESGWWVGQIRDGRCTASAGDIFERLTALGIE